MEIAIMLNLSRESVTRVFQALQTKNIVRRDGPSRLMVIDLATLKAFAEGNEEI
jgi:DNA-binding IclR family transcriptional regulator